VTVALRRGPEAALGLAMLVAAVVILHATNGQGFAVDELYYYARVAAKGGGLLHYPGQFSPEYLLAPFNGHLALGGRFVYETVFATVGAHYTAFVLIDVAGICASAALVFVFARRRLGDVGALAPALLVLFLGSAREQFLWPLDFNSSVALAAGLGAILCLQRRDSRGDLLACLLLGASAALIEVGLAFIAGAAVAIAIEPERRRRAWVIAAPLVLYACWWVWSSRFGQGGTDLANIVHAPQTIFHAAAVALGSLTGTNPMVPSSFGTEVTGLGRVLAILGAAVLAWRIVRGGVPRTIWVWIAVAIVYWTLLAIADRPPESTRYLMVGAVLLLLIAADCFPRPLSGRAGAVLVVLALLALPGNIDAMLTARDQNVLRSEVPKTRAELAMLELAGDRVDPALVVSADPRVVDVGGGLFLGIPAGAYLQSAEQNGSIAYTLGELVRQPEEVRAIADAALVSALATALKPSEPPPARAPCGPIDLRGPGSGTASLRPGRSYLLARGRRPVLIGLRRFASAGPGVPVGRLRPGGWTSLNLPTDAARQPWRLVVDGPITVCSVTSGAS
jgi:hypothetical protein